MRTPANVKNVLFVGGPLDGEVRTVPLDQMHWVSAVLDLTDKELEVSRRTNGTAKPSFRELRYEFHRVCTPMISLARRVATIAIPFGESLPRSGDVRGRIERFLYRQPIYWPEPSILDRFDEWWAWTCWRHDLYDELKDRTLRALGDPYAMRITPRMDYGVKILEPRAIFRNTTA